MTKRAVLNRRDAEEERRQDTPRPSQRALYRRLQVVQRRWETSRGKRRDEAWREMLRISKAMDEA
jgi:hypothetical protein